MFPHDPDLQNEYLATLLQLNRPAHVVSDTERVLANGFDMSDANRAKVYKARASPSSRKRSEGGRRLHDGRAEIPVRRRHKRNTEADPGCAADAELAAVQRVQGRVFIGPAPQFGFQ